jgi:hypothetical protein
MPTPHADFLCVNCDTTTDLPVKTTACPVCAGSLTRLYNSINVATPKLAHKTIEHLVAPGLQKHQDVQDSVARNAAEQKEYAARAAEAIAMQGGTIPVAPEMVAARQQGGGLRAGAALGMVNGPGREASRAVAGSLMRGWRSVKHTPAPR